MSENATRIIAISKDADLARRIKRIFADEPIHISWESNIDELLEYFHSHTYAIVIITSSDYKKNASDILKLVDLISTKSPVTQILFLVKPADVKLAMSALQAGSYQYTKLPVSDEELELLVRTALSRRPQYGENLLLLQGDREARFEQFIGRSLPMQKVYRQIRQAAATEIPILLLGDTGTGKDLSAQAIHNLGSRKDGPYIPVNLGALPSELVASELFGHEKGSFTGAMNQHKGKFEQAVDGTIFLDEIDSVDEKVQVSLLRLIEQKKFHRLGGKRAIRSNARIITASNQDLEALVRAGTFREDLFYRLDVFRIFLPPLRERHGDLPLLVEELIGQYNEQFRKNILGIAPECLGLLEAHDWPGNIRELKNVIQRAVIVCEGEMLLPEHLPPRFHARKQANPVVAFEIGTSLAQVEKEMIVRALELANNNRKRAAELLGISRRAIYNKLRKHKID